VCSGEKNWVAPKFFGVPFQLARLGRVTEAVQARSPEGFLEAEGLPRHVHTGRAVTRKRIHFPAQLQNSHAEA
jgi:hypothetical protein